MKNKIIEINFFNSHMFCPGVYVKHATYGVGQIDDFLENNMRLVSFVRSGCVGSSVITPKVFEMFYASKTDLTYEEFLACITIHETERECIELPLDELIVAQNPFDSKIVGKY